MNPQRKVARWDGRVAVLECGHRRTHWNDARPKMKRCVSCGRNEREAQWEGLLTEMEERLEKALDALRRRDKRWKHLGVEDVDAIREAVVNLQAAMVPAAKLLRTIQHVGISQSGLRVRTRTSSRG